MEDHREKEELEWHVAVLRLVPGATAVNTYNRNKPGASTLDLNKIGFFLKLNAGHGPKCINVHFNEKQQSLLACALAAREKVKQIVGETVILEAERQVSRRSAVREPLANLSEADQEWLAGWFDEQLDPSTVTLEEASAALNTHRSSASASTSSSAFLVLNDAQISTLLPPIPMHLDAIAVHVRYLAAVHVRYRTVPRCLPDCVHAHPERSPCALPCC